MRKKSPSPHLIAIADRVREKRQKLNLSQTELAKKTTVQRSTISAIERGERSMRVETILDLADSLDTSPDYLLRGGAEKKKLRLLGEDITKYSPQQQEYMVNQVKITMKHFDGEAKRKQDEDRDL
ncbi:MAG: helix-turn-helix domain-containing protein [Clostridiales bacterium]|nr:helix-turn-helix domain-containing protein [Clostridiales bacterium]